MKAWSGVAARAAAGAGGVDLREIEVVDDGYGRPGLRLHGAVARRGRRRSSRTCR